jgi:hypothetical protein
MNLNMANGSFFLSATVVDEDEVIKFLNVTKFGAIGTIIRGKWYAFLQ